VLSKEDMSEIVQKLTGTIIKRYRTEILADIDTKIETILLEFRDHVVHRSWLAAQKWCKWENDKYVLFPDFTRIYYRKGHREVLVQEYSPQVRMFSFHKSLAKAKNSEQAIWYRHNDENHTYSLALPYTIFIFSFQNGIFNNVYVCFSDRPLKDCHEPVYRPYLSNIDSNLRLCLGNDFDKTKLIIGNISQQAAYILSHFWQTVYSDEWSAHYWLYKSHFGKHDRRLATLEAWEKASLENPLFVIDDVKWLPHYETQVGDIILRIFEGETKDAEYGQEVYDEIYQVFQDTIRKTVLDELHLAEEKLPSAVMEKLTDELTVLVNSKIGESGVSDLHL
jgi:hypothetical protein